MCLMCVASRDSVLERGMWATTYLSEVISVLFRPSLEGTLWYIHVNEYTSRIGMLG